MATNEHGRLIGTGARMRAIRISSGVTLAEAAAAMGITAQALSQIERGVTKNVRLEHFLRFCARFNADPYFVVFGVPKSSLEPLT